MSKVPRHQWPIYQIDDGRPCRIQGFHYSETELVGTLKPQPMFVSDHPTEYDSPWLKTNRPECYTGWFELRQPKVVESRNPFDHLGSITDWSEQGYDSVVWRDPLAANAQFPAEVWLFNAQGAQITQMFPVPLVARIIAEQTPPPMFTPPEDSEFEYLIQIV